MQLNSLVELAMLFQILPMLCRLQYPVNTKQR